MTDRKADLQGLVSLIQQATNDAISAYEDSGTELPSLDVPSESPTNIIALRKALRVLEGACFQLCTTLAPPEATVFTRSIQCLDVGCLRVAVTAKIPDILAAHPEGLHVSEIAKKTNMEPGKLSKVLRSLALHHCFREVAADAYTNNRLSTTLLEANPFSALIEWVTTDVNRYVSSNIYDALVDPVYGPSYDANRTAWSYGTRHEIPEASIFEWLTQRTETGKLRQIIHNWPTDACVTILKNIAKVLKPESRILIHDYVLQPNFSGEEARGLAAASGVDVAPKPLLPNYGYGNSRAYMQDVNMLVLTNAGERTLDEFLAIGTAAGLRFVKLWDFAETALIEFAASP
ncbi:hypothetical protein EWM64_g7478 [Hericium alpestre]|uniref:O-methyltransferase dimerisation domain-containing protein n=1 Tax=Hericium alpestre TaxID=135208 RepID=A0A4Y9ZPM4_9AGAM|nr:hypothetical protein EWM64_g7478 [Hericium alpestre]